DPDAVAVAECRAEARIRDGVPPGRDEGRLARPVGSPEDDAGADFRRAQGHLDRQPAVEGDPGATVGVRQRLLKSSGAGPLRTRLALDSRSIECRRHLDSSHPAPETQSPDDRSTVDRRGSQITVCYSLLRNAA